MYCSKCGYKINSLKFCPRCGTKNMKKNVDKVIKNYVEPLKKEIIFSYLNKITNVHDINKTNENQRARNASYLIAEIYMLEHNRDDSNIFCDLLHDGYVSGKMNIEDCYSLYLQNRKSKVDLIESNLEIDFDINNNNVKYQPSNLTMMNFIEIKEIKRIVENITTNSFNIIDENKHMFEGYHPNGYKMILYITTIDYANDDNEFVLDFTLYEKEIVTKYKDGLFIIRVEEDRFFCFLWSEIITLLTSRRMVADSKTGGFWRLYMNYVNIRILNNDQLF